MGDMDWNGLPGLMVDFETSFVLDALSSWHEFGFGLKAC